VSEFLQAGAQGVLIGSTYGLLALGMGLLYGVSGVVNFSHGDFISLGMFLCLALYSALSLDPYVDGARHAGIQIFDQADDRAPVPDDRAINAWT
jgi:branched-subunit amino acid ABC-type transport system permease component